MKYYYDLENCEKIIPQYYEHNGYAIILDEGSLGLGVVLCFGDRLKTTIIKEVYLNEWSSAHTMRMYKKTPKKYQNIINKFLNDDANYNEVSLYQC